MWSKEFLNLFLNCAGCILPAVRIVTISRVKVCVKLRVIWSFSGRILPSFFASLSPFMGVLVIEKVRVILRVICVSKKMAKGGKKCQNLTHGHKKSLVNQLFTRLLGAHERNRTFTSLRMADFESAASTNSATWALS